MVGAAYGPAGVATGEVVGKVFTGFSDYIKANKAIKVFRAYGGDAKAAGFSWTTENPVNIPDFRNAAGLPSGEASGKINTQNVLSKVRLILTIL